MISSADKVYISICENARYEVLLQKAKCMQGRSVIAELNDKDRFYQHFEGMIKKIRIICGVGEMNEEERTIFYDCCIARLKQTYIDYIMNRSAAVHRGFKDGFHNWFRNSRILPLDWRCYESAVWEFGLLMALTCANGGEITPQHMECYMELMDEVFRTDKGKQLEIPTRASVRLLLDYMMPIIPDKYPAQA